MKIFVVSISAGEYEPNLGIYDHIISYHLTFSGAEAKISDLAKKWFDSPFSIVLHEKDRCLKLVCKNTDSSLDISVVEVES